MSYEEDLEKRNSHLEQELDQAIKLIELLIPVHVEAENFLFDSGYYEVTDPETTSYADFNVHPDDLDDLSDSISDDPKLLEYVADYLERINYED